MVCAAGTKSGSGSKTRGERTYLPSSARLEPRVICPWLTETSCTTGAKKETSTEW